MESRRIGLIGAGNRGRYLAKLLFQQRPDWRFELAIDPNPRSLERVERDVKVSPRSTAKSFGEIQNADEVDAWIMAAHESAHVEAARFLFPLRKPVYFEKPIGINMEEGRELMQLYRTYNTPVMVGYECRWAPFYARAREIIQSGRLGRIINLAAEERLEGGFFAAGWLRGPWRNEARSGSLLLTKCVHDMDYITWLLGSMPTHVSSFGGRRTFLPEPRATATCNPCSLRSTCHYSPENWTYPSPWKGGKEDVPDLNCVFNGPSDVVDHQEVQMLFPDGVNASFFVAAPYARSERRLSVAGSEAWLEGNMEDGELKIVPCHGGDVESVNLEGTKVTRTAAVIVESSPTSFAGSNNRARRQWPHWRMGFAVSPLSALRTIRVVHCARSTSPDIFPDMKSTRTAPDFREQERLRMHNLAWVRSKLVGCLRETLICDYHPGEVWYNLNEYPARPLRRPSEFDARLFAEYGEKTCREHSADDGCAHDAARRWRTSAQRFRDRDRGLSRRTGTS